MLHSLLPAAEASAGHGLVTGRESTPRSRCAPLELGSLLIQAGRADCPRASGFSRRTQLLLLILAMLPSCVQRPYAPGAVYGMLLNGELVQYAWDSAGAACIAHRDRRVMTGANTSGCRHSRAWHVSYSIWKREGKVLPNSWALWLSRAGQQLWIGDKEFDLSKGRLIVLGPPEDPLRCTQLDVGVPVGMSIEQLRSWVAKHETLMLKAQDGSAHAPPRLPLGVKE